MSNKEYTIIVSSSRSKFEIKGTLEELTKTVGYTLECGKSWERERGNKKINLKPKTIKSLVTNLNNAKSNSAANGYSDTSYKLSV